MTYFFNIYIYVDIFIIVFYLPYYCNIRYVVLSFDEIKTHYYYYYYLLSTINFFTLQLKCFDIATNRAASLIIMDVFIEELFQCTK